MPKLRVSTEAGQLQNRHRTTRYDVGKTVPRATADTSGQQGMGQTTSLGP
jgi:hypothetical protein